MVRNIVPDRTIIAKLGQQLSSRGMRPPCHVVVAAQNGTVTLSGNIQYEHQRHVARQVAQGMEGVGRVVDQMKVTAPKVAAKKPNQW